MINRLIQLTFGPIIQSEALTVLCFYAESRRFYICTERSVGEIIHKLVQEVPSSRPSTPDLLQLIVKGFSIRLKQVVINDLQNHTYFARLFLEMKSNGIRQIVEIDARPSDCIILALMNNAPLFCTQKVLDTAEPITEQEL